ncbi:MAG: hypothetical protein M3Z24_01665 [Chloroflexota bacterium]|nr:hypothetical protein [Chloroflexota bacterium]
MRKEAPIAICGFGWGRKLRLYRDYLEVHGQYYALANLTSIRPIYQRAWGISSVRLELQFGKKRFSLRGIAMEENAHKVIEYLTALDICIDQPASVPLQQTSGWSRTREHKLQFQTPLPSLAFQDENTEAIFEECSSLPLNDLCLTQIAEASTAKVEASPNWQRFRQEQRVRRERRLYIERSIRENGFDVEKLAQQLQEEALPIVSVPMRLLSGERAHYSTEVTLCAEPVGEAIRYTYPAKDYGTLILTNKRLLYIGRKSQIVLDYTRLLHVARLRGAIAFHAEHWYKREIFEVHRPLECTMYLECILQQFYRARQFQTFANAYIAEDGYREDEIETTALPMLSCNP